MVLFALAILCGCCENGSDGISTGFQKIRVAFQTNDDWQIVGDFYRPEKRKDNTPAALLLLHMYESNRHAWERLVPTALEAGMAVFAIDLRGHGESTSFKGERRTAGSFNPGPDFQNMSKDIAGALNILSTSFSTPKERVVLVGAGMGANLALIYAADNKEIPAVALISPGIVEKGLVLTESAAKYGARPSLIIAAGENEFNVRSMEELARRMVGGRTRLMTIEGQARGTELLATNQALVEKEIVGLAAEVLQPGGNH